MKLPPKPSGKGNKASRANTSTRHSDTDASKSSMGRKPRPSGQERQQKQADPTPSQGRGQRKKTLFLVSNKLNTPEKLSLAVMGAAFAVNPTLVCYGDNQFLSQGFEDAGTLLIPQGGHSVDSFDIIVYVKRPKIHKRSEIIAVDLQTYAKLEQFTDLAVTAAYKLTASA